MYRSECFRPDVNTFVTPELRVIKQCGKKRGGKEKPQRKNLWIFLGEDL